MKLSFKWRQFEKEPYQAVSWYLRYALSYRDLEEMMKDHGILIDHTTIFRWVVKYGP